MRLTCAGNKTAAAKVQSNAVGKCVLNLTNGCCVEQIRESAGATRAYRNVHVLDPRLET